MKIIALDIGNVHTGVAYADDLNIIAIPYTTVATHQLPIWLAELFAKEPISTVIVGHPKTLAGKESQQTQSTVTLKNQLEQQFPTIQWLLVDERLTSKQAQQIMRIKKKNTKKQEHPIAAALILQIYLEGLRIKFSNKH